MIQTNKYQTQLTDELLNSLHPEVKEGLLDAVTNIEFIRRLVSLDRKFARDLPRRDGKIIVDIMSPHILEDMEYFRPTGNYYRKYGVLTNLRPNANPNSEFAKWIKLELDRIWYGMIRPSDGEWITGDMYFYLNYTPIVLSKIRKGTKQADRIIDFPECWEGNYLFFHYIDLARNGGIYNDWQGGEHAIEIAKRGAGKSFSVASILAKIFVCGENKISNKNVRGVVTAYQKESLVKDGTLNKFIDTIDFCAEHTLFPAQRLKDSLADMAWKMGYKDAESGINKGTNNEVLGVTAKDNVEKSRGKRSSRFIYEEFGAFKRFIDIWNVNLPSVLEGNIVFGQALGIGTGGSEGSDFSGALEIIYNPIGYNVYALPNLFDKNSLGKLKSVFFFGTYLNRKGWYNNDGVSDVVGALIEVFLNRVKLKYNSTDPMALSRNMAENPITILEAIMRRDSNFYPVADINDTLNEIDVDPRCLDYIGCGYLDLKGGVVSFKPSMDNMPIREFPHKDNKLTGCIEVHKPPVADSSGKVLSGRYVGGCLIPGEKVMTNKGLISVEDVKYNNLLINESGDLVNIKALLTHNVIDKNIYTLKLSNTFRTTTFTEEHPILSSKKIIKYNGISKVKLGLPERYYNYDFKYNCIKDITSDYFIKVPNIYKKVNNNILQYWNNTNCRIDRTIKNPLYNKEFWWFIGVWLGDGWCESDGYKISICFNVLELDNIKRCKEIIDTLFKRKYSERIRLNCLEISFSFQLLSLFLTTHFGKYSYGKLIPEWAKYIKPDLKYNLISGYISSDGCVSKSIHGYFIGFTSINLKLLESVLDILFSIGIISGLNKLRNAGTHNICGKEHPTKECYQLRVAHNDSCKLLELMNDTKNPKLNKLIRVIKKTHLNSRMKCFFEDTSNNYIYFKIEKIIESKYTGPVYNFECDTHTYMCHHITTHNCDVYDDDASETLSLGSVYILDLMTDLIVCEFTGRPLFADDFYETVRRMAMWYNAQVNYENNKKGLFGYFSKMNCTYLLSDTLEFLKDKEMMKGGLYGNKSKGTLSTAPIKSYGRKFLRDWLLKPIELCKLENGEEVYYTIPKVKTLKSRALLKELSIWNPDGNFDRHDAMLMLMLIREDKMIMFGERTPSNALSNVDKNYLGDDAFFKNNYRKK